jgi:hypothetical protein
LLGIIRPGEPADGPQQRDDKNGDTEKKRHIYLS